MPFDVQVRHNPEYKGGSSQPRYFLHIDLSPLLPRPVGSWLEVYWRTSPGHPVFKELYWVEVAGRRLEKGNLPTLVKAVPEVLISMAGFGTFPYYYLTYPGGEPIPVYHSEGKLRLKMNGGELSGYEVGEVWQRMGDGLLGKKLISSREELEVHLLLWQDLCLYPTALALKGGRHWVPLFFQSSSSETELLYDVIGVPTRFLPAREAFNLRREVAHSLVAARSLSSPHDLGMDAVLPPVWQGLERVATPTGFYLRYPTERSPIEMPVYEAGGDFFALAAEPKRKLYFGATPEELVPRVAMELSRERRLSSSALLSMERHKGR